MNRSKRFPFFLHVTFPNPKACRDSTLTPRAPIKTTPASKPALMEDVYVRVCVCLSALSPLNQPHYSCSVFVYQSTAPHTHTHGSRDNSKRCTVVDYAHGICLLRGLFEITIILLTHFSLSHLNKEDRRGN